MLCAYQVLKNDVGDGHHDVRPTECSVPDTPPKVQRTHRAGGTKLKRRVLVLTQFRMLLYSQDAVEENAARSQADSESGAVTIELGKVDTDVESCVLEKSIKVAIPALRKLKALSVWPIRVNTANPQNRGQKNQIFLQIADTDSGQLQIKSMYFISERHAKSFLQLLWKAHDSIKYNMKIDEAFAGDADVGDKNYFEKLWGDFMSFMQLCCGGGEIIQYDAQLKPSRQEFKN